MNQDSFADSTPSDAGVGEQLHGAESAPSASHSTITLAWGLFAPHSAGSDQGRTP